jgi:ABC-type multidrug transport system ATPase subunit
VRARAAAANSPAAKAPAAATTAAAKAPAAKTPAKRPTAAVKAAGAGAAGAAKSAPARKPPVRTSPAARKPAARKPAETKPAETKPAETKPAETQPAAAQPVAAKAPAPRTQPQTKSSSPSSVATGPLVAAPDAKAAAGDTPDSGDSSKTAPSSTSVTGGAAEIVLAITGLTKKYDDKLAVDHIDLSVRAGTIFGIVGPNGAGKTTTLSMATGLLRPDAGTVAVHGADVWSDPVVAKRNMGVLPDRLRLFDRLTGTQLLYYSGVLRGLSAATVKSRIADLAVAFGLEDALDRLVTDYSAGMTKKVALAAAMIHSPRLLVLDEPFESVDPVSAANVIEILQKYVAAGGTVVLSSHSMDLIQRVCDSVAIVVSGRVLAAGTMDEVRGDGTLEDRFVELAGGRRSAEGMEWLHSFSD